MDTINRDELRGKIDQGDRFRLVETLPEDSFHEGHIPGAVNLPPDRIRDAAAGMLPDHDEEIVVYCGSASCSASEDAARQLADQGYTRVRRYVGGKQDWKDAGMPIEASSTAKSSP